MSCIWKIHSASGVENFIQSLSSLLISLVVTSTSRVFYSALWGLSGFKSEGENE